MNSIFHINVFSQIALTPSSPIEWQEGIMTMPTEEWKLGTSRIRTAVATGLLALSLSTGAQERPTATAMIDTQPILLAQANIEDGRTGPYSAIVPQVNGGTKMVEYYKNKRGLIIPPPIENGKLADGSNAPADPLEAKAEQRSIIAKYDKVVLVKTEKNDILYKANKELWVITTLAEQGKLTKEELYKWFYSTYLIKLWLGSENTNKSIEDNNKIIRGLEAYGKISLKLSTSDIELMKKLAEQKAKETMNRFSSATA